MWDAETRYTKYKFVQKVYQYANAQRVAFANLQAKVEAACLANPAPESLLRNGPIFPFTMSLLSPPPRNY